MTRPIRARVLLVAFLLALARGADAQVILGEGFDDVSALPAAGWVVVNASLFPLVPWFQGNPDVFPAQSGAPRSYVAANFLASEAGDVRVWLITPEIPLTGGETLTFYTRAENVPAFSFADGLSVTLGVGASTSLENFTIGLVELGPVLGPGPYPTSWQLYTVVIPQITGMTSGRIAFLDFAEDAGSASYIGLDSVTVSGLPDGDGDSVPDATDNCPTIVNPGQEDGDVDAVGNLCDSCTAISNPRVPTGFFTTNGWATLTGGQRDDDHDGFGNRCDAKFPGVAGTLVGSGDLIQFRASNGKNRTGDTCGTLATRPCAIFDLDESSLLIGTPDLSQFRLMNGKAPGPRCPACPLACSAGASGSCN